MRIVSTMLLLRKRDAINSQITSKNKILATLSTGFVFLLIPIMIFVLDPIFMIVNYKLRLAKGTILYNLLQHEIPAATMSIYIFNITNADRFLSGEDYKLKVEEVGPFVFQEYRWYIDLGMSEDGKSMGMTPRIRSEFLPEASVGHPKDMNLTLPNLPFLAAVALLSNYPSFIRYAFNVMASQIGATPIMNMDVHSFLYGYRNPLIVLCNSLVPGLVPFNHFGLLDRLYENESDYRVTVGATYHDRFKIKSVKKIMHIHTEDHAFSHVEESEQTFKEDTYEGGAYPPMLTPEVPLNLYRQGICRTWHLENIGSRIMDYGGEALVYTISNNTFINNVNPITSKKYPDGLMDIAECFYGLPFVISKGHFVDVDPKVMERVEGLKPDRKVHVNEILIDRKASITYNTKLSMQLTLMLDDMSSNSLTKIMSHSVFPVAYVKLDQPKMTEATMSKFVLVYQIAPYIVLCVEIVSVLFGLAFLGHALRLLYLNSISRTNEMVFQNAVKQKLIYPELPLEIVK